MHEFRQSTPFATPAVPFTEAEKTTPRYTGTAILAIAGVPLAAGVAGAVIVLMFALALDADHPWRIGAAGFAVAGTVALAVILANLMPLLQERQTILGQSAAPPLEPPAPSRVQIEITEPQAGRWRLVDLPGVTPAQLAELARGLVIGRPFSESEWCGRGRPFSKPQFIAMRAELLERGIFAPRHPGSPQQGFTMTEAGRHVMERIAETGPIVRNRAHARTVPQITAGTEPGESRDVEHD